MQALLHLGQNKMTQQQLGEQLCQTSHTARELASCTTTSSQFSSSTNKPTGKQQVLFGEKSRAGVMLEGALWDKLVMQKRMEED